MRAVSGILYLSLIIFSFIQPAFSTGKNDLPKDFNDPPFLSQKSKWVDSVMNSLTLEEKIGQLILVDAYSSSDKDNADKVIQLILNNKIGGVIFFKGGPVHQAELTNRFQSASKVPLLIAMDAEWGLDMRLDSTIQYPFAMALGSLQDNNLVYRMGKQIGEQLSRIGVHMNFAPDLDVNNNPRNPVINIRSFGEDRINVTLKGLAYMLGMQEQRIIAVGKHFPGHGDTDTDSHFGLPVINNSRQRLDSIELFPFRYLIQGGISGIMSGHLYLSRLDTVPGRPASLSPEILQGILRRELGYKGLVMTDAMNMKGMSSFATKGSLDVQALIAGNDMLLMPASVQAAVDSIRNALTTGKLTEKDIDERCRKVLMAKAWAGLDNYRPVQLDGLVRDLHRMDYQLLNRQLCREMITIVKNKDSILPFRRLDTLRLASVTIGEWPDSVFNTSLELYAPVTHFFINRNDSAAAYFKLMQDLSAFNLVMVTPTWTDIRAARNFGLKQASLDFIDSLAQLKPSVLCLTANPYALSLLLNREKLKAIVLGYEDMPLVRAMMAQAVFGAFPVNARLPVGIDSFALNHEGVEMDQPVRFSYMLPEELNVNLDTLRLIEELVNKAIHEEAFPGCQIMAAKNGQVFYNRSFGYQTYDSLVPVTNDALFDLASVTKIGATLPSVMKLYDQHRIGLKDKLGNDLPEALNTNKSKLLLQDILTHQAGLQTWIPFYIYTMQPLSKGKNLTSKKYSEEYPFRVDKNFYLYRQIGYKPGIYRSDSSSTYSWQVAQHMWINNNWRDTVLRKIYDSPLSKKKEYLYSDLSFLLLWRMVEYQTGKPLEQYSAEQFFHPLGNSHMCFRPLQFFSVNIMMPTENDLFWRRQLVQGTVHDMGAAMLGGVAGHAGLFSNANDLAKLMQMYLNGGTYGSERYFEQSTIQLFTSAPFAKNGNRRGLGFDKPFLDLSKGTGSSCPEASMQSFGHTGFTGTIAWADPETGIVFVFLSNRVYPTAENNKLSDLNIRPRIQEIIYHSLPAKETEAK